VTAGALADALSALIDAADAPDQLRAIGEELARVLVEDQVADDDLVQLRARYRARALRALRQQAEAEATVTHDRDSREH
jgi:hypothetical protein